MGRYHSHTFFISKPRHQRLDGHTTLPNTSRSFLPNPHAVLFLHMFFFVLFFFVFCLFLSCVHFFVSRLAPLMTCLQVLQHADEDSAVGSVGGLSEQRGGAQGGWGEGVASLAGLPPPPDKGCPCVVLRTGFETSQGQLMKTILFATKRVAAGSDWETGLFIFILLVFAAVASAFVLAEVRKVFGYRVVVDE